MKRSYKPKAEFYKTRGRKPQWFWRIKASNGRIIDASSEGFSSKQAAQNNFKRVQRFFKTGK
jgi:uncharacterized protein YegP (UPF0339 family)